MICTRAPLDLGTVNRRDVGYKCVGSVFSHLVEKPATGRFLDSLVVDYNYPDVRLQQKRARLMRIGKSLDDPRIAHALGDHLHDRFVARKNRYGPTPFERGSGRLPLGCERSPMRGLAAYFVLREKFQLIVPLEH